MEGIFRSTPEGHIITVNPALVKMLGYNSPKELTDTVTDIAHQVYADPAHRAEITHLLETVTKVSGFECEFLRKDGSKIWVRLNVRAARDAEGLPLYYEGTLEDITERKKSEAKLLEQNMILNAIAQVHEEAQRFKTLEEFGKSCLKLVESITGSKFSLIGEVKTDGLMHDIALSDPGWALCTMRDKTGHRISPGAFKIRGLYGYVVGSGKCLLTNDPYSHPESIGTPEGHPRLTAFLGIPFVQSGRVVGMIGVGNREGGYAERDKEVLEALTPTILESLLRKRAEEALRESEERLRLAHKATNDVVWDWDIINDTQRWNDAGIVVFGWTEIVEGPVNAHWWVERVHPEDRQKVDENFFAVVNDPQADNWTDEYRFLKADGSYAEVVDRGYVLRDARGKAVRMIGAMRDITSSKLAAETLQRNMMGEVRLYG